MVQCSHAKECRSKQAHYHVCKKLCGFARRLREARPRDLEQKTSSKKEKPKRHFKCDLDPGKCADFECHYHNGRAKVTLEDIELSILPRMAKKDAEAALEMYNLAVDVTVCDTSDMTSLDEAKYSAFFNDDGDDGLYDDEREHEHEDDCKGHYFDAQDAFQSPAFGDDDHKHNGPSVYAAHLRTKAAAEMATIIDLIDENVEPSNEEKKHASGMVGPDIAQDGNCTALEAVQDGVYVQEPTETVIIFTRHDIAQPVYGLGLARYLRYHAREAGKMMGILWALPAVQTNPSGGHVLSNVLLQARSDSNLLAWFWQPWRDSSIDHMTDCINLLDGAFTHAYDAEIYTELAKYVLTHQKLTLLDSSLLENGKLKHVHALRVDNLIAYHPDRQRFLEQTLLVNTKTFICNQLLIRGMIHMSREPLSGHKAARVSMDFQRGARFKTSQQCAPLSASPQQIATLFRSTVTTVPSGW